MDAAAGVADLEAHAHAAAETSVDQLRIRDDLRGDRDADAALGGELDRVADEVDEDLAEFAAVGDDLAGQGGPRREGEGDAFFLRLEGEHLVHRLEEGEELEGLVVPLHLSGLDLREVEDLVDDVEEVLAAVVDDVEGLALLRSQGLVFAKNLGKSDDGVQGRAQLVRHLREEVALGPVGDLAWCRASSRWRR